MKLLYDKSDLHHAKKLRDERFAWLQALSDTVFSYNVGGGYKTYRLLHPASNGVR